MLKTSLPVVCHLGTPRVYKTQHIAHLYIRQECEVRRPARLNEDTDLHMQMSTGAPIRAAPACSAPRTLSAT